MLENLNVQLVVQELFPKKDNHIVRFALKEHILPIIQNIASLVLLELIHMLKLLLVLLVQQELLRIMVICFVIKL